MLEANNLVGTFRQIEWATAIRLKFLSEIESLDKTKEFVFDNFCVISYAEITQLICEEQSAEFFIDNRRLDTLSLCRILCLKRLKLMPVSPTGKVDVKAEAAFLLARIQKFRQLITERESLLLEQSRQLSSFIYTAGIDRDEARLPYSNYQNRSDVESLLDRIVDLNRELEKTISHLVRISNSN
jgi:hypothetical protein